MDLFNTLKLIHISTVSISLILFISRAVLLFSQSPWLQHPALRILPHINDTILLVSAISMLVTAELIPNTENIWLVAKIVAMVVYIMLGMTLFKWAKSMLSKQLVFILALLTYGYIICTAISKTINPLIH